MKKFNIILVLLLISVSANVLAKESLAHQMWQFAYPSAQIPKTIPYHAKTALGKYRRGEIVVVTFSKNGQKANDNEEKIVINADYGNGYLLLRTVGIRGSDKEEVLSGNEIVAFKDGKGNYTIFNSDISQMKQYGGQCTLFPMGKSFTSNRPLSATFPEINLQTFAPDVVISSAQAPLHYLSVDFPNKGTTVTATAKPLLYLLSEPQQKGALLAYGDLGQTVVGDSNVWVHLLVDWVKQIGDEQSVNALLSGEAMNSADEQALTRILQEHVQEFRTPDITEEAQMQTLRQQHLPMVLRWLDKVYQVEKNMRYRSVKLVWDRKQGRFHIAKKIPAKQPPTSLYAYLIALPELGTEYYCYDGYRGYYEY